ncbi:two-component system, OmpR family, phosphate regulon response regulator OmpR [Tistlia consotensis]|uniref:Two-component system, OmpR family, phosphate regulon response regulator OmpR n=1 Tax=Tistlia consotensis USBA 355 TaxID=560819 RepID=A0A1Y6CFI5_9PROT|nr:response regulator [Tistlia consotensis]SMF60897.1 two-component system, OmpR family, phosphate regulon response regulator OmpR [Tistlia consotensis USBA 355]SNR92529.1 two-component system, OmpR family, phosphate regulon response regulator OmpR [Tistlia consotensis]
MAMSESPTTGRRTADESAVHILVVDDDTRLRELLKRFLSERGYLVLEAADAAEARARLAAFDVDLIVLDIMMPGESGLELTQALRRDKQVPILLLTAMDEVESRIAGFESGADDYLSKPFEPRELLLRIQAILRRTAAMPAAEPPRPQSLRFGRFVFDLTREELREERIDGHRFVRLTAAETVLLAALARRPGVAIGREALAAESPDIGNQRTIDVQMTRLRRKIEDDPKYPRYLQTVRGIGYALIPD